VLTSRHCEATAHHQILHVSTPQSSLQLQCSRTRQMPLHHMKLHQTYTNALNAAEAAYVKTTTPEEAHRPPGHPQIQRQWYVFPCPMFKVNVLPVRPHQPLFWKNLTPAADANKGHAQVFRDGKLKIKIIHAFGGVEVFKKEFDAMNAGIWGSGLGWLVHYPLSSGVPCID
jgi:Fe-Mn family superoxide dismutase